MNEPRGMAKDRAWCSADVIFFDVSSRLVAMVWNTVQASNAGEGKRHKAQLMIWVIRFVVRFLMENALTLSFPELQEIKYVYMPTVYVNFEEGGEFISSSSVIHGCPQAFLLHVFHTVIRCKEYRMSPN
jgi:hypothetical protein